MITLTGEISSYRSCCGTLFVTVNGREEMSLNDEQESNFLKIFKSGKSKTGTLTIDGDDVSFVEAEAEAEAEVKG